MPRGGRSSSISGRRPAHAPAPAPSRPMTSAPGRPTPATAAAPRQPGLFGQMAAVGTGVAVGTVVGNSIESAMTGNRRGDQQVATPVAGSSQGGQQQQQQYPCQRELQQFLDCTEKQADISLCNGFNEALRQCRVRFGV